MVLRVHATVRGAEELARRFEARAGAAAGPEIQAALLEAGTLVQSEAQRLVLDGPKTGRIYQKYVPRRTHQASAPGEPPANDLGNLVANIVQDRADLGRGRIIIASLASYAKMLEFGTSKMAARPYLRAAMMNMRGAVQRAFRAALLRRRA